MEIGENTILSAGNKHVNITLDGTLTIEQYDDFGLVATMVFSREEFMALLENFQDHGAGILIALRKMENQERAGK